MLWPEHELLYLDWQPGVTPAGFRQGLIAAVTLTRVQALRRWITDNAHVYPLPPAEQLWLQEHVLLSLNHSSLQRVAIVVPAALPRVVPESLIRSSRSLVSYEIKYFSTQADAFHWVLAAPNLSASF